MPEIRTLDFSYSPTWSDLLLVCTVIIDVLNSLRQDRDLTGVLVLAALTQTKASRVLRDPELKRRFAHANTPIPRDLRLAISINALAASLGLPFETVRRRTNQFVREGLCEMSAGGVVVSDEFLQSDSHLTALRELFGLARSLRLRVASGEADRRDFALASMDGVAGHPEIPLRSVGRAVIGYFLRSLEQLLPQHSSPIQTFVSLAIVRLCLLEIAGGLRAQEPIGLHGRVTDAALRPIRASAVSDLLSLPHETVRRNVIMLTRTKCFLRVEGGVIPSVASLAHPMALGLINANLQNLQRMIQGLDEDAPSIPW